MTTKTGDEVRRRLMHVLFGFSGWLDGVAVFGRLDARWSEPWRRAVWEISYQVGALGCKLRRPAKTFTGEG